MQAVGEGALDGGLGQVVLGGVAMPTERATAKTSGRWLMSPARPAVEDGPSDRARDSWLAAIHLAAVADRPIGTGWIGAGWR